MAKMDYQKQSKFKNGAFDRRDERKSAGEKWLEKHDRDMAKKIGKLTADLNALMAACQPLIDAEDAARSRAQRMQELAALARTDQAVAKLQRDALDRQPSVHDVGDVCAEIRRVMRRISK